MSSHNEGKKCAILLSGNEAISFGAIEAGVGFCSSYPGTPSTEILETLIANSKKYGYYTEWSTNEKVALESAAGASWMGIPSICSMKSLGLNVAADFLLNVNLSGSGKGGLVIVVCDDPRGHSSSNEQDSRFYARAAKLPLFEPTSAQEAKDVMLAAFEISKKYEIPVIVRSTTRLSHARSLVNLGKMTKQNHKSSPTIPDNLFNVPNPHLKHKELMEKLVKIQREFEKLKLNYWPRMNGKDLLIIASGVSYQYAKEAVDVLSLDNIGVAKLVTSYPFMESSLLEVVDKSKKILFVEEGNSFIEDQSLAILASTHKDEPIKFFGKRNRFVPNHGEMNVDFVAHAIQRILEIKKQDSDEIESTRENARKILIPRPLTFCAGCTHRNVYFAINKVKRRLKGKLIVAGDIGCYSLGVFYNRAMDTMQAMGSGIGAASGLGQLYRFSQKNKILAVAGDSTFFHSCVPALVNARHQNADLTFLILDNETTAMTGFQEHPASKMQRDNSTKVEIDSIVKAIQPDLFEIATSTDVEELVKIIYAAVKKPGLKVLQLKGVCRLEEGKRGIVGINPVIINEDLCKGSDCKICVKDYACTAIKWNDERDKPIILEHVCVKCGSCISVCPNDAISMEEK